MAFFRARLVWLAALTLTFQVGVLAAAATAVCCKPQAAKAASTDDMPCCKDGGSPGHVCPLPAKKPKPAGTPIMESCCDVEQQILAALLGFTGIPEAPSTTLAAPESVLNELPLAEQPIALVRPPDSPPPRA